MLSHSVVSDSATPWTAALQAPLSVGILQAWILEWGAIPSSRGSSQPRDRIQVSCIAGRFFTFWATREAQYVNLTYAWCGSRHIYVYTHTYTVVYLILSTTLWCKHYYTHFTDEETEPPKDQGIHPRSQSKSDSHIFLLSCLIRISVGTIWSIVFQ